MTQTKSRLIYTAGTFAIPAALAVCRRLIITLSVLRKPDIQLYQNEKSNPAKGFLGYASLFVNQYCDKLIPLEFSPQTVLVWDNPAIQLYYSIICAGINNSQVTQALGAAMTPPAIVVLLPAIVAAFPGCLYTNIKFKLLPGTRLQVDAVGEEVVSCAGVTPEATLPDTFVPAAPYPADRARSDDPARSLPEEGELPGDTAIATIDDPDLGLPSIRCFRTRNKGLLSGDIVFENFICAANVFTQSGAPYGGAATVDIVAVDLSGAEISRTSQASFASNPVEIVAGANPSVRQPEHSFGNCDSCS